MLDLPPAASDDPKGPRPGEEPSVRERCLQDDRIYPAWHFERSALTWAGDCWQRPTPEQWEEFFHLPRAYTFVEGLPDCPKQRELARLRMLGNT